MSDKNDSNNDGLFREVKESPVLAMCADYKVIEAMLDNLADDPAKRLFM